MSDLEAKLLSQLQKLRTIQTMQSIASYIDKRNPNYDPSKALEMYGQIHDPDQLHRIQEEVRLLDPKESLPFQEQTPWVKELFEKHLPKTEPDCIVSLGPGVGLELIPLRESYPSAHIIGIDTFSGMRGESVNSNNIMAGGLYNAMFSGAELRRQDFSDPKNLEDIVRAGSKPLVVARNVGPIIDLDPSNPWNFGLPLWAIAVVLNQGNMMITSLDPLDASLITVMLKKFQIPFQYSPFLGGNRLRLKGSLLDESNTRYAEKSGIGSTYHYYYNQTEAYAQSDAHVFTIG